MGIDGLNRLRDGLMGACARAVKGVCEDIRAEGAALCPVDTGELKRSIACETLAEDGVARGAVKTGARYAAKVELGSVRQPAKPFLHPAFSLHAAELAGRVAQELNGLM